MSKPRFIGDIKVDVNDHDAEYARIAKFLDEFMPPENIIIEKVDLHNDQRATYESVEVIRNLIEQGKRDWVVRRTAEKIVQYLPPKDYAGEINAVFNFVTRRLRYTKDIHQVETVHRVRELLRWHKKAADCDDFTILTGALLESIGHPVRLVIIGSNYSDAEDYSHIYLQVLLKDKWVSLDGSVPGAKAGWEAPVFASKKIIELDGTLAHAEKKGYSDLFFYFIIIVFIIYLFRR